jgi:hypothetical protein
MRIRPRQTRRLEHIQHERRLTKKKREEQDGDSSAKVD